MQPRKIAMERLARIVGIVTIITLALGAGLVLLPLHPGASTSLTTSSSSASSPVSYSTGQSTTGPRPATIDESIAADCNGAQSNGSAFFEAVAGTNAPAVICVQFYYYNSFQGYNASAPLTLNVSAALSIQAVQEVLSDGLVYSQSFDGSPNFTLTASQSQLAIGGPANANEGTMVAYAVAGNPGASGTYQLGIFPSASLSLWLLNPQEPENCGYYGELVAGDGQPNYAQNLGGCVTYATSYLSSSATSTASSYYTVPGIPYPLLVGNVYFRIIGVSNSTA